MTKLAALIGALIITVLCVVTALYAMKLSMLVLMHWQAMVAFSALLYVVPILVVAFRRRRSAKLQAAKEDAQTPVIRHPLREL